MYNSSVCALCVVALQWSLLQAWSIWPLLFYSLQHGLITGKFQEQWQVRKDDTGEWQTESAACSMGRHTHTHTPQLTTASSNPATVSWGREAGSGISGASIYEGQVAVSGEGRGREEGISRKTGSCLWVSLVSLKTTICTQDTKGFFQGPLWKQKGHILRI